MAISAKPFWERQRKNASERRTMTEDVRLKDGSHVNVSWSDLQNLNVRVNLGWLELFTLSLIGVGLWIAIELHQMNARATPAHSAISTQKDLPHVTP